MNNYKYALAGSMPAWLLTGFKNRGIEIITIGPSDKLQKAVRSHADMLSYKTADGRILLARDIQLSEQMFKSGAKYEYIDEELKSEYPADIRLNCLRTDKFILCKKAYTAKKILDDADKHNLAIIDTNQGYAKCSTCNIGNNAIITEDPSIANNLNGVISALKISIGSVAVCGFDYGFIGGASAQISDDEIGFFGNLELLPEHRLIEEFINENGFKAVSLDTNNVPVDIGGIVFI